MTDETIIKLRKNLNEVREKYSTPISKMARDTNIERSYLSRWLSEKEFRPINKESFDNLTAWLEYVRS